MLCIAVPVGDVLPNGKALAPLLDKQRIPQLTSHAQILAAPHQSIRPDAFTTTSGINGTLDKGGTTGDADDAAVDKEGVLSGEDVWREEGVRSAGEERPAAGSKGGQEDASVSDLGKVQRAIRLDFNVLITDWRAQDALDIVIKGLFQCGFGIGGGMDVVVLIGLLGEYQEAGDGRRGR